jgi:hypothetical protein
LLAKQGANQLPVFLANAMIETYFMGPPEKNDKPSCMYCHSTANGSSIKQPLDLSFALQGSVSNQQQCFASTTQDDGNESGNSPGVCAKEELGETESEMKANCFVTNQEP